MKPAIDHALRVFAGQLMLGIAPEIGRPYSKSSAEIIGMMLVEAAEEYDRAADVRVEENRAMRAIFRGAAPEVPEAELRRKLEVAAAEEETSLRVSALEESNGRLRALLIELHALVEEHDAAWARRVDREIWAELRASAARRALSFFPG